MVIAAHEIDDYKGHLIAALRELETFKKLPYYDRATQNSEHEYQNVTMGDGINMDWSNGLHLRQVLNQLGLVESSTQLERALRVENGLPLETEVEKVNRLNNMVAEFQQLFSEHRPAEGDNDVTYENTAALNNLSAQYGGGGFYEQKGRVYIFHKMELP